MLKFSGYPYLIRGQPEVGVSADDFRALTPVSRATTMHHAEERAASAEDFEARGGPRRPTPSGAGLVEMTLEQACPPEYQGAQCAFKDSMIH